jgi:hypothetical protein
LRWRWSVEAHRRELIEGLYAVAQWRTMKGREINGKDVIKVMYELDEGQYIPFGSSVLDS